MSLGDLFFQPADLYKKLQLFDTPFDFVKHDVETFEILTNGYQQDMVKENQTTPMHITAYSEAIILLNKKWARRISGVFSNELANKSPDKAHVVLTEQQHGHYIVSIRSPLNRKQGADTLASQFSTGEGVKRLQE